jgi:branched-chain amino acid transport system substrate-binding protein
MIKSIAVLAAFGLVAAACGGDDDDSADEPVDSVEEPAAEPSDEPADEPADGDDMASEFDLDGRTVTVAVENAYLPFNYLDPETGEPTGWDYDTIDALCEILNCVPEYQTFSWEPMIQAVADGQFDMAADGITITEERAELVDFSNGYIAIEQRLLVPLDSEFTSVDDVIAADCSVASQVGTTNLQTAIDTFGEDRVTALEEFGFVVQSVIAGDSCAAVIDETAGQGYVGANADEVQLIGDSLSSDQLGFIFPKGSDLVEPFNYALDQMKQDGSLEAISQEFFGDSFTITYDDIPFPECDDEGNCELPGEGGEGDGEASGDGLVLGYVLPQTGGLAVIVDALVKPIEMAQEEILDAGGDLTIIPSDSGTDVNVASASVDGLIADGVNGIIGPAATGVTLGVIDKITGSNIVECSGSTTGTVFTTYDDNGFYFRTSPPDSLQAPVLADTITDDGATSVAIVAIGNEYGSSFASLLADALDANGVAVATTVTYDENATSFDAEVSELADSGADAIAIISYAEGATLMQGMIEAGIGPADIPIYVTDGFKDNVTGEAVDPDDPAVLEGIRGTAPSVAPPDGEPSFLERFAEFAPDAPTIFSGHFYDCVMVMTLASEAAGSTDPAVYVEFMQSVTVDGTECTGYAECSELLAAGEDINYQGASGVVDFSDDGEPTAGAYDVYTYDAESAAQTEDTISFSSI